MKALGIVRRIDHLGRITIPMEIRRVHGWNTGTPIEMFATDKGLLLKEYGAEQKKLAVIEGLKSLADMVDDDTALAIIGDIMEYVKGEGKS
jgi:bifunctional DNA-binding transcriptional regulator/antitoxin component of YhaV-PrlF toxin-antitoxin module